MGLRILPRRQSKFLSSIAPSSCLQRTTSPFRPSQQIRNAHVVPPIRNEGEDERLKLEGIPGLFSPGAYNVAWTEYQQFMVDRLNTILANDQTRAQWGIKDLLINTARDPNLAPTFNYASMAHNNHFFFSTLSNSATEPPQDLTKHLSTSFGSIDALRDTMLSTAAGMFGPGFVWLVQEERPSNAHPAMANTSNINTGTNPDQLHFRTLITYLAGTPYPSAHTRQQGIDMNVQNLASAENFNKHTRIQNDVGSFGRLSSSARGGMDSISMSTTGYDDGGDARRFGGADITPLLCVNTWEHCYLHDYGVAGKREYLANWWERIDWNTVLSNCVFRQGSRGFRY